MNIFFVVLPLPKMDKYICDMVNPHQQCNGLVDLINDYVGSYLFYVIHKEHEINTRNIEINLLFNHTLPDQSRFFTISFGEISQSSQVNIKQLKKLLGGEFVSGRKLN